MSQAGGVLEQEHLDYLLMGGVSSATLGRPRFTHDIDLFIRPEKAVVAAEHVPRHWYDALGLIARCELDWEYLVSRARRHGIRRVVSLLVYVQSDDLEVPSSAIHELYQSLYQA